MLVRNYSKMCKELGNLSDLWTSWFLFISKLCCQACFLRRSRKKRRQANLCMRAHLYLFTVGCSKCKTVVYSVISLTATRDIYGNMLYTCYCACLVSTGLFKRISLRKSFKAATIQLTSIVWTFCCCDVTEMKPACRTRRLSW